jgi:hypothetical protein
MPNRCRAMPEDAPVPVGSLTFQGQGVLSGYREEACHRVIAIQTSAFGTRAHAGSGNSDGALSRNKFRQPTHSPEVSRPVRVESTPGKRKVLRVVRMPSHPGRYVTAVTPFLARARGLRTRVELRIVTTCARCYRPRNNMIQPLGPRFTPPESHWQRQRSCRRPLAR